MSRTTAAEIARLDASEQAALTSYLATKPRQGRWVIRKVLGEELLLGRVQVVDGRLEVVSDKFPPGVLDALLSLAPTMGDGNGQVTATGGIVLGGVAARSGVLSVAPRGGIVLGGSLTSRVSRPRPRRPRRPTPVEDPPAPVTRTRPSMRDTAPMSDVAVDELLDRVADELAPDADVDDLVLDVLRRLVIRRARELLAAREPLDRDLGREPDLDRELLVSIDTESSTNNVRYCTRCRHRPADPGFKSCTRCRRWARESRRRVRAARRAPASSVKVTAEAAA